MGISFDRVSETAEHIDALYDLLKKRKHNISHLSVPTYAEHMSFVRNSPYRDWILIKMLDEYVGSFYVTNMNTIGINILDEYIESVLPCVILEVKSRYAPLPEVKSVRAGVFSINVAPSNSRVISILEGLGCGLTQVSYFVG